MFLNLNFIAFNNAHRETFERIFRDYPPPLAVYTFGGLLAWQQKYQRTWSLVRKDLILIATIYEEQMHLLQPLGNFTDKDAEMLLKEQKALNYPLQIMAVSDTFLLQHPYLGLHCEARLHRERAEYIYRTADLANLTGGHYERKRNLIAQARKLYAWQVHLMTSEHHGTCFKILASIGQRQKAPAMAVELEKELVALQLALNHFDALNLKGLVITVDARPVAFSIFEALDRNTAVVHFEKAEIEYKGLYQIINQETAKVIQTYGFKYINREEDLGLEGLRKAKLSYSPVALLSNYTLTLKSIP